MTDTRMEEAVQQIEGIVISQMNKGVPGPYLPPEFAALENALIAKIKEDKRQRGRRHKAEAVDAP